MNYRKQLKKRKNLVPAIIKKYQDMGNPIPGIIVEHAGKIAFLPTHLASGSQIDYQFHGMAIRNGLVPMWVPFAQDTFQSYNQRKKMFLYTYDKFGNVEKLTNPNKWEGKKLSDIILDSGENLEKYHLKKWQEIPGKKFQCEMSQWLQFFGKAQDYYYHILTLEVALGISFWPSNTSLYEEGEKEHLLKNVIIPESKKVFQEYGVMPMRETFELKPVLY